LIYFVEVQAQASALCAAMRQESTQGGADRSTARQGLDVDTMARSSAHQNRERNKRNMFIYAAE
jgi:hypothetical protein